MYTSRWWPIWCAAAAVGCGGGQPQPGAPAQSAGSRDALLVGIVTAAPPETPASLQQKRAELESQLKLAQESVGRGELAGAIRLLEDCVKLDPRHRTVLLLLTQCLQTQSKLLVAEEPGQAYRLMVQSGGYLRMLQDTHPDLSTDEREILADVLFDEACAHARSQRQEETSSSLAAAIAAGFDDLDRLGSEPDFDHFRRIPAMARLLSEAASQVESRALDQARQLLAASPASEFDLPPGFAASAGKVRVLVVGDGPDERRQRLHNQLAQIQQRLSSPELKISHLDQGETALVSLSGSPQRPAILFIDRAGKLRLTLFGVQSSAVLEAICRELLYSPSPS